MIPAQDKQGNDMTKLNNETRELNINELDAVSGGSNCENAIAISGVYFLTSKILGLLGDQTGSAYFEGKGEGVQTGGCGTPGIKPR
jgi:bacteriocin-like protein